MFGMLRCAFKKVMEQRQRQADQIVARYLASRRGQPDLQNGSTLRPLHGANAATKDACNVRTDEQVMSDVVEAGPRGQAGNLRVRQVSWGDPDIGIAASRSLSGLDFVRKIASGEIPKPPTFELIDFSLVEAEFGRVVAEIVPAEFHYNPAGVVHGGIVCTLLDSVLGLAVLTRQAVGFGFTTLEVKVNFVRPISIETGPLLASGQVVHPGARISTSEGQLVDRSGKLFAHGTATCMVLPYK